MFNQSYEWYLSNKKNISLESKTSAHKRPINEAVLKVLDYFLNEIAILT